MATRRRTRCSASRFGEVTNRDFVAIGEFLCEGRAPNHLKERPAGYFKTQNARFDTGRFMRATESCRRV
jgi:hypothetical protein